MSEHKLRKIIEHNNRLKEQLELPRIPVSQASEALISYTQSTKDYLLPSIWGPPPHDPFASQAGGGQARSASGLALPQTPSTHQHTADPRHVARAVLGCLLYPCLVCFKPYLSTSSHPPADCILFDPIFRRYVKHATLIERCFPPEKSAETVPNSNELSYLVYYAQSKPAKLTKVGAYLSKRAAKDVQRRRRPDVYVALRIYDALLGACARDLNFFAKDVLGTLDVALSADDIGFTEVATQTFALFCRCHSGLTLAIDNDLSTLYSRLITTFAAHAQASFSSQQVAVKNIDFGLRAIQAIAESQATYASDSCYELPRIVKAVLSRIASAPASMFPAPASDEQSISAITQDAEAQLDDEQLGRCAWRCLETLVRRSHGQHSRAIVAEIFKYLESVQQWQPVDLCVHVVTSVIGQLQSQDQNMVIVETLALLADGTLSSHASIDDTKEHAVAKAQSASSTKIASRRACIIRILENLFCQPYILVGISVMEALGVLVTFLLQFIEDEPLLKPDHLLFASTLAATSATAELEDTASVAQSKTLDQAGPVSDHYHLLAAIGGLAKHQYYSDQLADMAGYLVSQLRLDAPVSENGDQGCERQLWLLQALSMILNNSHGGKLGLRQTSTLPLEVFASLFTLITHERPDVSAQAADCIVDILRHNHRGSAESTWVSAQRLGLDDPLCQKLGGSLSRSHRRELPYRSAGYAAVAAILRELLSPPCTASVHHALALVDDCSPEHCDAAWVTLLAMVWSHVARAHANSRLEAHVRAFVDEAKRVGCWDGGIEDVCLNNCRVALVYTSDVQGSESPADAKKLADKLTSSTVIPLLGSQSYSSQSEVAAKLRDSDSSSADRALCSAGDRDIGVLSPPKAIDQTKHARARVSVDWEIQGRRDSTTVPQIGIGHLRAALRDGLAMHSSDRVDGTSAVNGNSAHSLEKPAPEIQQPQTVAATDRIDAYGQPISSEVCELLDSIEDTELLAPVANGNRTETRNSPNISTPVINHFD
ncbi:plasma membrane localization protein [Coemansia pectinata]|uniref:Guanine nucleotide-binding protein subunit gamma n=1 Tax=Coemansia pectinata TaxID=1052879 RepID=A0A9W8LC93_9FUNG|nr:plasma membrane localization protein [Coemansia pectinata]